MRFLVALFSVLVLLAASVQSTKASTYTVPQIIQNAARWHGVNEYTLRRVAWCESSFRPWVTNPSGAMGLFQFMPRTWRWMSWAAGWGGSSAYNPVAAANVAAWAFANGYARHWVCY